MNGMDLKEDGADMVAEEYKNRIATLMSIKLQKDEVDKILADAKGKEHRAYLKVCKNLGVSLWNIYDKSAIEAMLQSARYPPQPCSATQVFSDCLTPWKPLD